MLKKVILSLLLSAGYGHGLEQAVMQIGEATGNLLDPKTTFKLGVSILGACSAVNFINNEDSFLNFVKSDVGQKRIVCGTILAALTATALPVKQWIVNLSGSFVGYAVSKMTQDVFPNSISFLATVSSCCLTAVLVSRALEQVQDSDRSSSSKKENNIVVKIPK